MATASLDQRWLIDTDVLIWSLRGQPKAVHAIAKAGDWRICAVTYMELVQGCRDKAELKRLQKVFKSSEDEVLPITQAISELACTLVEKYSLSHSLYLAGALIAATALHHSLPLLTGNLKHFAAVAGLQVKAFTP